MNKIVNYVKNENCFYINTDAYEFKKANWLIKILKFLKIIDEYEKQVVEVKTKQLDCEAIQKKIYLLMNEIGIAGYEIKEFIIGRKEIAMLEDEFTALNFNMNFRVVENGIMKIYDIPISINPFIDGIVPVLKN